MLFKNKGGRPFILGQPMLNDFTETYYDFVSTTFSFSQRLTRVSTFTPLWCANCSISESRSGSIGMAAAIWKSTSGVLGLSNLLKSCLSQNSPTFSGEFAFETELLFAGTGFALFLTHVACTNYNRCVFAGFEDKENRQISTTKRLTECSIDVFTCNITFFRKADSRTI